MFLDETSQKRGPTSSFIGSLAKAFREGDKGGFSFLESRPEGMVVPDPVALFIQGACERRGCVHLTRGFGEVGLVNFQKRENKSQSSPGVR